MPKVSDNKAQTTLFEIEVKNIATAKVVKKTKGVKNLEKLQVERLGLNSIYHKFGDYISNHRSNKTRLK